MLTPAGAVKGLDFGLAKAAAAVATGTDPIGNGRPNAQLQWLAWRSKRREWTSTWPDCEVALRP